MFVTIDHPHECKCIAVAPAMAEGRDWWVGKLQKPVDNLPDETHCLHMKTEYKNVTFLCNEADFRNLLILCRCIIKQPSEAWTESMMEIAFNHCRHRHPLPIQ